MYVNVDTPSRNVYFLIIFKAMKTSKYMAIRLVTIYFLIQLYNFGEKLNHKRYRQTDGHASIMYRVASLIYYIFTILFEKTPIDTILIPHVTSHCVCVCFFESFTLGCSETLAFFGNRRHFLNHGSSHKIVGRETSLSASLLVGETPLLLTLFVHLSVVTLPR